MSFLLAYPSCFEHSSLRLYQKEAKDLEPTAIRSMADSYARQQVLSQAEQFSEFGIMADWGTDSTYRTLGAYSRLPG